MELARPMIVVTNLGISAHITPDGAVAADLPAQKEAVGNWSVQPYEGQTPFVAWRNVPLFLLLIVFGGWLYWDKLRQRRRTAFSFEQYKTTIASISWLPKSTVRQWALGLLIWASLFNQHLVFNDFTPIRRGSVMSAFTEAACIGSIAGGSLWSRCSAIRWACRCRTPRFYRPNKHSSRATALWFISTHFLEPRMIAEQALKLQVGQRVADYTREPHRRCDCRAFACRVERHCRQTARNRARGVAACRAKIPERVRHGRTARA